ncbi:PqqD family protein [Colwellia sp. UCD-KL20]|uniref:PqqD family protein n=1 Tax=Colwellia sp. UCD-KL20 TaxID=1917165 RepID=UPI0009707A66|nr:PqqD family protein [Colwellia sp. UCD-KL20]
MLSNTSKYQLVDNVLFQKVDNETVILEPENGNYFTLDPVGTFMIESLQEGKNVAQVIESIKSTYDVSVNEVEADLKELLTNMISQKLIIERG